MSQVRNLVAVACYPATLRSGATGNGSPQRKRVVRYILRVCYPQGSRRCSFVRQRGLDWSAC